MFSLHKKETAGISQIYKRTIETLEISSMWKIIIMNMVANFIRVSICMHYKLLFSVGQLSFPVVQILNRLRTWANCTGKVWQLFALGGQAFISQIIASFQNMQCNTHIYYLRDKIKCHIFHKVKVRYYKIANKLISLR